MADNTTTLKELSRCVSRPQHSSGIVRLRDTPKAAAVFGEVFGFTPKVVVRRRVGRKFEWFACGPDKAHSPISVAFVKSTTKVLLGYGLSTEGLSEGERVAVRGLWRE